PGIAQLAAAWAALEAFSYLSAAREVRTLGRVLVYEPDSMRLTTERVLRIPWCAACSRRIWAGLNAAQRSMIESLIPELVGPHFGVLEQIERVAPEPDDVPLEVYAGWLA